MDPVGGVGYTVRDYLVRPRALVESDEIGLRTRVWGFAHIMEGGTFYEGSKRVGTATWVSGLPML